MAEISHGRGGWRRRRCATDPAIGPGPLAVREQLWQASVTIGAKVRLILDFGFLILDCGNGLCIGGVIEDCRVISYRAVSVFASGKIFDHGSGFSSRRVVHNWRLIFDRNAIVSIVAGNFDFVPTRGGKLFDCGNEFGKHTGDAGHGASRQRDGWIGG